jgi:D-aspartate ligase
VSTPTAFVLTHESEPGRTRKSISKIALAIARSLGRKGIPVVRLHPNLMDHGLASKYHQRVVVCPDFYASEEELVEFLLTFKNDPASPRVLIPASDDCAYFCGRHYARLSEVFLVLGPPWSVMERLVDKRRQYEAAQQFGVPIPETYFPASAEDVRALAPSLKHYPYIIKPVVSHRWRRPGVKAVSKGRKALRAETPEQLIAQYELISQVFRDVMIQEVIGGRDERLFTFLSYFNERSEPIAYCIRKKIRQYPVDFGFCTLTESCIDRTVEEQSIRLLQGIGFHGISGVEWKLDPDTNQYKLIEINARAVNTTGLAPACGVDIPYLAFMDKTTKSVAPVRTWREGVKWVSLSSDIWAAKELHRSGALSLAEWWRSMEGVRTHAVYASDDLKPFVGYLGAFLVHLGQMVGKKVGLVRRPSEAPETA